MSARRPGRLLLNRRTAAASVGLLAALTVILVFAWPALSGLFSVKPETVSLPLTSPSGLVRELMLGQPFPSDITVDIPESISQAEPSNITISSPDPLPSSTEAVPRVYLVQEGEAVAEGVVSVIGRETDHLSVTVEWSPHDEWFPRGATSMLIVLDLSAEGSEDYRPATLWFFTGPVTLEP